MDISPDNSLELFHVSWVAKVGFTDPAKNAMNIERKLLGETNYWYHPTLVTVCYHGNNRTYFPGKNPCYTRISPEGLFLYHIQVSYRGDCILVREFFVGWLICNNREALL